MYVQYIFYFYTLLIISNLPSLNIISILRNEFGFIENSEIMECVKVPFVSIFPHATSLVIISTYTRLH